MWEELRSSLKSIPSRGREFPLPTDASLDAAEKKLKLKLPAGYREFAKAFGCGKLGDYFLISVPVKDLQMSDLAFFSDFVRDNAELYEDMYGDKAFVKRMVGFGSTVGGDILVWDPKDVTDKANNEYGIYVLPDDKDKIVKLSKDFAGFVENAVFGANFKKALKLKKWTTEKTFEPWGKDTPGV